ncbi:MAG: class I mannose-6-phosphate isomerase [Thermoguttaceae bacterium]|nr:class I mannose-6-phosphate isomerase [Thermoguttaceae bacterium]MDW8039411.1 class I mannose-6-phosphate isomerase [Thermoguttaceae bacterium]
MEVALYPLRFEPIFQRYLWGGHRLRRLLGKPTGPEPCAESWEICDRPQHQSIVAAGPLKGRSLHELLQQYRAALVGAADLSFPSGSVGGSEGRFPLLIKFLDAAQTLSVQVHPNDQQAADWKLPDPGKTEAWVVLAAEPGSLIYAGFRPGLSRQQLLQALQQGNCADLLHSFEPKPGDCVFLPAGTVHALGAGLLVAEIQQNSDITFRLWDWGRLGPDGKPRPLHIQEALAAVDFNRGPVFPQTPQPLPEKEGVHLVQCPYFTIRRWRIEKKHHVGGDGRFHIVILVDGLGTLEKEPVPQAWGPGTCWLLPACLHPVAVTPIEGVLTFLDVFVEEPELS